MSEMTTRIRVLGIVGSPRKGGNTETLVDAVLAGAEEAGAATEKVLLRDRSAELTAKPGDRPVPGLRRLPADRACRRTTCRPSWVLGTPVYWWGPTAQFKAFLDRWYGSDRKAVFPGKRVILTIPFEDTTAAAPRHAVGILTESLNYVGAEVVTTVLAPGVHRRGEVRERMDLMAAAWNAGRDNDK